MTPTIVVLGRRGGDNLIASDQKVARIVAAPGSRAVGDWLGRAKSAPVSLTDELRPWDRDGVDDVASYVERPDIAPLGGESFNAFQERVLGAVLPLLEEAKANPERGLVAVVADPLVTRVVDGWCKTGCQPDGAVDIETVLSDDDCSVVARWDGRIWRRDDEESLRPLIQDVFDGLLNKENDPMRDPYQVLGEHFCQEVGFDWQGLVSNLATTAEGIKTSVESDKAKKKAEEEQTRALSKVVAADAAWASAETNLELSVAPAARAAAMVVRDQAQREAEQAASALSTENLQKRCDSAQRELKSSGTAAHAAPTDAVKQARMHAWQKVAAACNTSSALARGDFGLEKRKSSGENWLTKKSAGLPTWGWGLIGVGAVTALIFLVRGLRRKA